MQQEPIPPSHLLYKASLNAGEIPVDLKPTIITSIYKGGSENLPKNYCPVSVTSHLIKIPLKNITKKLPPIIPRNPKQHDFRSGRSCLSQLLEHYEKILEELETSNNVDNIYLYLDFAKAFDKIDHVLLVNKLKNIVINCKVGPWIDNFLSSRQQFAAVNGTSGEVSYHKCMC